MQAHKIKQAFNKAQASYDINNGLQFAVGKRLINLTKHFCKKPQYLIDIGCGTGATTENLAASLPFKSLHAFDIADALLAKAKERFATRNNVHLYEADFNQALAIPETFDLLFSNMALHWSQDFYSSLGFLTKLMHRDSILAFSIPSLGTLSQLSPQYARHTFFSQAEVLTHLKQHHFHCLYQMQETHRFTFDNLLMALKSIKQVGANYTGQSSTKSLKGKSFFNFHLPQTLTYEIAYFIVRRADDI